MGVFHVFKIVQMVLCMAKHHMFRYDFRVTTFLLFKKLFSSVIILTTVNARFRDPFIKSFTFNEGKRGGGIERHDKSTPSKIY